MLCDVVDTIENDTHTLFIDSIVEGYITNEKQPMSYQYYQKHKEELFEIKS